MNVGYSLVRHFEKYESVFEGILVDNTKTEQVKTELIKIKFDKQNIRVTKKANKWRFYSVRLCSEFRNK